MNKPPLIDDEYRIGSKSALTWEFDNKAPIPVLIPIAVHSYPNRELKEEL
jgi:hypothetical protein